MKTLYLVRHAKSSWEDRDQTDFERALNNRGELDAPLMAKALKLKDAKPEVMISSPAIRAYTTAQIFAGEFGYDSDGIVTDDRIYEAGIRELMIVLREIDNRFKSAFLFGHNPGLTSLTNLLGDKFIPEMPTCAVAGLKFDLELWKEIERGSGKIILFDYPKNHHK